MLFYNDMHNLISKQSLEKLIKLFKYLENKKIIFLKICFVCVSIASYNKTF